VCDGEGCKPGSVPCRRFRTPRWEPFLWGMRCRIPQARTREHRASSPSSFLSLPCFSCSGWGLPTAASPQQPVSSYLTLSPLPRNGRSRKQGGILSVALSLGSPPVGVTDHPALRSPDFPPAHNASGPPPLSAAPAHSIRSRSNYNPNHQPRRRLPTPPVARTPADSRWDPTTPQEWHQRLQPTARQHDAIRKPRVVASLSMPTYPAPLGTFPLEDSS